MKMKMKKKLVILLGLTIIVLCSCKSSNKEALINIADKGGILDQYTEYINNDSKLHPIDKNIRLNEVKSIKSILKHENN